MSYPILAAGQQIGFAEIAEIGLYQQVCCHCQFTEGEIRRVLMRFEDKTVDLGLWVRENQEFVIRKRIPRKAFGRGVPDFTAIPQLAKKEETLIRLEEGKPVQDLEQLANCRLRFDKGGAYLQIQSKESDAPD